MLVTLVAGRRLPGGLPGAFVSVVAALAVYGVLRVLGLAHAAPGAAAAAASTIALAVPWPSLAFLGGLSLAWGYLPIVLPFGVMTIIGGIDNTESAAAAGDEYTPGHTPEGGFRDDVVAGLCGGVVESTALHRPPRVQRRWAPRGLRRGHPRLRGLGGMSATPFLIV